ncbi:MAG: hypothetical protein IIC49_04035, partial [Planctomycetes bacterium]|nr:hypothetical protein [Planctomycetota bacterium]
MPPTRARIRPNPVPAVVETSSELGSLQRVAEALLTSRQPLALWTDPAWTVDPKPLFDALETHADIDLAFAWPHATAPRLVSTPTTRPSSTTTRSTCVPVAKRTPRALAKARYAIAKSVGCKYPSLGHQSTDLTRSKFSSGHFSWA